MITFGLELTEFEHIQKFQNIFKIHICPQIFFGLLNNFTLHLNWTKKKKKNALNFDFHNFFRAKVFLIKEEKYLSCSIDKSKIFFKTFTHEFGICKFINKLFFYYITFNYQCWCSYSFIHLSINTHNLANTFPIIN